MTNPPQPAETPTPTPQMWMPQTEFGEQYACMKREADRLRAENAELRDERDSIAGLLECQRADVTTRDERIVTQAAELAAQRATIARLLEASLNYMSQFGQALEAHAIPYGRDQAEADQELRAALAQLDATAKKGTP